MAAPITRTQRRSNRVNRGRNGRDAQLDRLGEQLAAPTRQKKRRFVPEDGLILENNALAPAPAKKRRSKKVFRSRPYGVMTHVFGPSFSLFSYLFQTNFPTFAVILSPFLQLSQFSRNKTRKTRDI